MTLSDNEALQIVRNNEARMRLLAKMSTTATYAAFGIAGIGTVTDAAFNATRCLGGIMGGFAFAGIALYLAPFGGHKDD
jgi:diacylglycerol kinase family enzyme